MSYFRDEFGYNVIGFISGNFGLAAAARNSIRVMDRNELPFKVVDVDTGDGRCGEDLSCVGLGSPSAETAPFTVNLFHMNPPEIGLALHQHMTIDTLRGVNGCVPFWELPALPVHWIDVLSRLDFVLTPSEFIHRAIADAVPGLPCIPYPQAAILPEDVQANRSRWRIPDEAVVFATAFDMNSDLDRKNPWAVIGAFRRAFPRPKNEYLLVKMSANTQAKALWAREYGEIKRLCKETPHVILIDEILPYSRVLELYASCDVFVSLHRSEGLGLCLMEAMTYGKPVVTTSWSGNMDFTTAENSMLVDFDLVPVSSRHPAYDPRALAFPAQWAEARIEHAAECLEQVARDEALRDRLGSQASRDMQALRDRFWQGAVWAEVEEQVLDASSPIMVRARGKRPETMDADAS